MQGTVVAIGAPSNTRRAQTTYDKIQPSLTAHRSSAFVTCAEPSRGHAYGDGTDEIANIVGAALTATMIYPASANALAPGQVDNFQDGTTDNWVTNLLAMGSPPIVPVNVATGGPSGTGDRFLLLTSTGTDGPAGRLVALNFQQQWAGNLIAAGINAISMNVNNFGSSDVLLRLQFADPVTGPPTNEAYTSAILVPATSGWRSITFPVGPSFLTADVGTVLGALTNATELRLGYGGPSLSGGEPVYAACDGKVVSRATRGNVR